MCTCSPRVGALLADVAADGADVAGADVGARIASAAGPPAEAHHISSAARLSAARAAA